LRVKDGVRVEPDFIYTSDKNQEWMPVQELKDWVMTQKTKIEVA
jgi:hypothetical protein